MNQTNANGFTLVELMVALALSSIVGVVMVSAYQGQVRSKNTQEALTDMNQAARAAFEIMTNEIGMAGLDSTENANARIVLADDGELIFSLDRGDGADNAPDEDCCDGNEQIRYHLSPAASDGDDDGVNDNIAGGVECNLGRQTGSGLIAALGCGGGIGPLQPLARNVDALNFVYLDQNGAVLATPVAIPAPPARNPIRSIQVTIVARAGTESRGFFYDFTNNDAYDNLQGVEILPAQNDRFRRLRIAATINCRNSGI